MREAVPASADQTGGDSCCGEPSPGRRGRLCQGAAAAAAFARLYRQGAGLRSAACTTSCAGWSPDTPATCAGRSVVLKPNLVEFEPASSINTHPMLVHAAFEAFRALGAASVRIAEGPGHRRNTLDLADAAGLLPDRSRLRGPFRGPQPGRGHPRSAARTSFAASRNSTCPTQRWAPTCWSRWPR